MQSAGYADAVPDAVPKESADSSLEIGEYLSFADLDNEDDGLVLAANKPFNIPYTPEAVALAEKGFAKGSNPAKMIVTQGLTLNQIAALGRKLSVESKDGSGTV